MSLKLEAKLSEHVPGVSAWMLRANLKLPPGPSSSSSLPSSAAAPPGGTIGDRMTSLRGWAGSSEGISIRRAPSRPVPSPSVVQPTPVPTAPTAAAGGGGGGRSDTEGSWRQQDAPPMATPRPAGTAPLTIVPAAAETVARAPRVAAPAFCTNTTVEGGGTTAAADGADALPVVSELLRRQSSEDAEQRRNEGPWTALGMPPPRGHSEMGLDSRLRKKQPWWTKDPETRREAVRARTVDEEDASDTAQRYRARREADRRLTKQRTKDRRYKQATARDLTLEREPSTEPPQPPLPPPPLRRELSDEGRALLGGLLG